ncbi:MAG: hypothetical protein JNK82_34300, partial [Myxococcaceae bacterium]|nr:hypothetical protein [Myxococcaceae bacterium]
MRTRPMALWLCVAACSSPTPPAPRAPDPVRSTVTLGTTVPVANDTTELELFITSLDADGVP